MANELILIVEDNPKNLKLVRDTLQVKGYQTLEAETGEEGVQLARERRPALILMDIQLPGMSGIEALGGTSCGSHDPDDSGHRRYGVGHGTGPAAGHGGRVRRLPGQAHQRAGTPGDGAWALGEILSVSP